MLQLGRNDPCHCGSGKKYKKCHLPLEEGRPSRQKAIHSAHTLRDKNRALLEAMTEIFGLERGWQRVKQGLSDAQIIEFYSFVAALWPAIGGKVSGEDRRELSFDRLNGHARILPLRV